MHPTTHPFLDLPALLQAVRADCPGTTLYCLGDHGGMPGLGRELARAGIGWRSLFAGSSEEKAIEVAPLLFAIDEAAHTGRSALLAWVAEHGTYTSSMLLLASPLGIDELAARLARRLDAVIEDDIEVMLRFFDPRVFEALAAVLPAPDRDAFLGIAACWWFADREGVLLARPAPFQETDAFEAPLRLDAAQEVALLAASEPDQVAARLAEIVPDQWRRLPLPARHGFIARQMDAARAWGVASLHELALYCAAALLEGEGFAASPRWRVAIGQVRDGKIGFGEAVARVGA